MESIKEVVAFNCKRLLDRSINLSELARSMQINPTTISRWKSGDHSPELDKIDRLASLIKVEPGEFFRPISEGEKIKSLPVSKTLQKLMAIPDEVYEYGQHIPKSDKRWEQVIAILELGAVNNQLSGLDKSKT